MPSPQLPPALKRLAVVGIAVSNGIAAWVLGAWSLGAWQWTTFGGQFTPAAPSTAVVLLLLGGATLLRVLAPGSRDARTLALVLAGLGAAICLAAGGGSLSGGPWLAKSAPESGGGTDLIGQMSLITGGILLLTAAGLGMLFRPFVRHRPFRYMGFFLVAFSAVFGLVVTLAYAAGAPLFYGHGLVPMAFLTALAVVALNAALLAVYVGGPIHRNALFVALWRPLMALALVGLAAGLAGFYALRSRQREQRDQTWRELGTIADLKAGQVSNWRQERISDARFLMRAPFVAKDLAAFFARPDAAETRADVIGWLNLMKGGQRYDVVAVFDQDLHPRLTIPETALTVDADLRQHLEAAVQSRAVAMGDMYLADPVGAIRLEVVAPVYRPDSDPAAPALEGLVLLRLDPRRFLFPLLQNWPVPSATAETLLVRREGDQVVYLNELRHRPDTALVLRRPLSEVLLPAVGAPAGRPGPSEGVDYRGVPVFATHRTIPGTSWLLVAKVDQAEVYASLNQQALTAGVIAAVLLMAGTLGFVIHWRRTQSETLRRQREQLEAVVKERTAALDAEMDVRLRADAKLRVHSESGHLLQDISASLLAATPGDTDTAIEAGLKKLAAFAAADAAYVFAFDEAHQHFSQTHLWCGPALTTRKEDLQHLEVAAMPWWMNQLVAGREVIVPRVAALPPEAAVEKGIILAQGVAAIVDVPMMLHDQAIGFIGLSSTKEGRLWQTEDTSLLRTVAQVIVSALQRQAAEEEVRRHRENLEELVARRTAALYESERRFESLFEQAQVAIGVSRRGRVLFANPACLQLFGFAQAEEMTGAELIGMIAPAARPAIAERLRRRVESEAAPEEYETTGLRRDGTEFPMRAAISRIDLADGPATLAFLSDITARKVAEAALQKSEERYRTLAETASTGIFIHRGAQVLYANEQLAEMLGYTMAAEVIGRSVWEFVAPEEQARLREFTAGRLAGRSAPRQYEARLRRKYGESLWVVITASVTDYEGGPAILGGLVDISERKRAEVALRESEERFRNLVEHAPDAVFVGTRAEGHPQATFAYLNAVAVKLFGAAAPEALIGQPILERIHPEHREGVLAEMRDLAQRKFIGPVEQVYLRLDGSSIPVEVSVAHLIYRGLDAAVVFVRDISERKKAEETIREQTFLLETANDAIMVRDLEHRVLYWNKSAERLYGWTAEEMLGRPAPDLQMVDRDSFFGAFHQVMQTGDWTGEVHHVTKARQEITVLSRWSLVRDAQGRPKSIFVINTDITERKKLETQLYRAQRLESIGQLASGIAHDLNNILAPLIMVAPLLRAEISNPDTLRLVDILENNAKRGVDVVKQIMTFSRGMKGGRGPVPTRPLFKETINVLEETFPRSITIHSSVPEDVWMVEGDATQLHQVLMNLCVNARDAMPDGGTLTLAAENIEVDELYASMSPLAKPGPYVVWLVADTGLGIAPEIMDRIFDPFFTTKEPGKGTGLGLSTVLGIVRNHGGFLKVDSKVGKGTQFRVYLPAQTTAAPASDAPLPAAVPSGRGETILVVDDEEGVRLLTKKILEQHGYHVLLAAEGSEAVVAYAQHAAEISGVLTDLMMPLMDGATLIRALKQIAPAVKIMATTGVTEGAQVTAALRLGAKEVLRKPYPPRILLERLRALLDG